MATAHSINVSIGVDDKKFLSQIDVDKAAVNGFKQHVERTQIKMPALSGVDGKAGGLRSIGPEVARITNLFGGATAEAGKLGKAISGASDAATSLLLGGLNPISIALVAAGAAAQVLRMHFDAIVEADEKLKGNDKSFVEGLEKSAKDSPLHRAREFAEKQQDADRMFGLSPEQAEIKRLKMMASHSDKSGRHNEARLMRQEIADAEKFTKDIEYRTQRKKEEAEYAEKLKKDEAERLRIAERVSNATERRDDLTRNLAEVEANRAEDEEFKRRDRDSNAMDNGNNKAVLKGSREDYIARVKSAQQSLKSQDPDLRDERRHRQRVEELLRDIARADRAILEAQGEPVRIP